jgi:ribosomal protein S18 acetylase RimI-like enzyme
MNPGLISYRPAAAADFDFLFALHEAAMRPAVEIVYGPWDAEWQRAYFRQHFDPAATRIIRVDGRDAGMLQTQERAEELFLVRLEILPAYQRRGAGTAVVRALVEQAAAQGKPVALRVLKGNIPARNFYQRLGFGVTGETDTHYIMASKM